MFQIEVLFRNAACCCVASRACSYVSLPLSSLSRSWSIPAASPPSSPLEYPPQHAGAQSHTAAEPGPGKQAICSSLKQRLITAFESPITCHTMRGGSVCSIHCRLLMTGAQAAITQPLNIAFYTQHISLNNRTQRAQIAPLIVINGI